MSVSRAMYYGNIYSDSTLCVIQIIIHNTGFINKLFIFICDKQCSGQALQFL